MQRFARQEKQCLEVGPGASSGVPLASTTAPAPRKRVWLLVLGATAVFYLSCSTGDSTELRVGRQEAHFAAQRTSGVAGADAALVAPGGGESSVNYGTLVLVLAMAAYYAMSMSEAQARQTLEQEAPDPPKPDKPIKKPRIDAFDSLRFCLIAYIASGHFIFTATKNDLILRLITQINVVVGAFFVLSGYVAAYTTTELGQREGSVRLNNAVEFAVTRIMGFWPLHLLVLAIFAPMFMWVDAKYSGLPVALWNGFLSVTMLQAWFPVSAEIWNAPTWFLSAFAFALCVLPYALRILAKQRKAELRRTLVFLTMFSLIPKLGYSVDLDAWGIMEGSLNARTHPNYALFNATRFSPLGAVLEVLMGAAACRLVMLDDASEGERSGSPLGPLAAILGLIVLRATGAVALNDMIIRAVVFIPLWIVFMMRLHRESVGKNGSSKPLPKLLCNPALLYMGSISFPIFIVHGPIGQLLYKKAIVTAVFGGPLSSPSQGGVDWFFGVYWAVVIASAVLVQKFFLESKGVKTFSGNLSKALIKVL